MYHLIIACIFTFLGLIPVQILRVMLNWNGVILGIASVILFVLGLLYAEYVDEQIQLNFAKTLGVCCSLITIALTIALFIYGFLWFLTLFN